MRDGPGNWNVGAKTASGDCCILLLFLLVNCGVLPAETVPGFLRAGRTGSFSLELSASAGGVSDSYRGDGWRGGTVPTYGLCVDLGAVCKLVLLECALPGRFTGGPCADTLVTAIWLV